MLLEEKPLNWLAEPESTLPEKVAETVSGGPPWFGQFAVMVPPRKLAVHCFPFKITVQSPPRSPKRESAGAVRCPEAERPPTLQLTVKLLEVTVAEQVSPTSRVLVRVHVPPALNGMPPILIAAPVRLMVTPDEPPVPVPVSPLMATDPVVVSTWSVAAAAPQVRVPVLGVLEPEAVTTRSHVPARALPPPPGPVPPPPQLPPTTAAMKASTNAWMRHMRSLPIVECSFS
jgi:hypothetical protein